MRRPDVPCADCGKLLWSTATSLPEGERRCLDCKRARPVHKPVARVLRFKGLCGVCGVEIWRRDSIPRLYCSQACVNHLRMVRPEGAWTTRSARDLAAPGLGRKARTRLLRRWQASGKKCVFCGADPTTVDHLVPLVLGGTNFEGNLAPACKSCNSRKQSRLVIRFKTELLNDRKALQGV